MYVTFGDVICRKAAWRPRGRDHGLVYANGIFSREHQAKLLATSGPYQGLGLCVHMGLFSGAHAKFLATSIATYKGLGLAPPGVLANTSHSHHSNRVILREQTPLWGVCESNFKKQATNCLLF